MEISAADKYYLPYPDPRVVPPSEFLRKADKNAQIAVERVEQSN